MKAVGLPQLILFVISDLSLITTSQGACPPWFFPDSDNAVMKQLKYLSVAKVLPC